MTSKQKRDFRGTSKWKKFRAWVKKERKVDEITLSPLYTKFNVHHLNPAEYTNLDPEAFSALNVKTHKFVEWLYPYYKKDHSIISRIVDLLRKMQEYEERLLTHNTKGPSPEDQ